MTDPVPRPKIDPLLRMAVSRGLHQSAESLIARGANVNAVDSSGRTALLLAVRSGDRKICTILLEAGADPLDGGTQAVTPLEEALITPRNDLVSLLNRYIKDKDGPVPPSATSKDRQEEENQDLSGQTFRGGRAALYLPDDEEWETEPESDLPEGDDELIDQASDVQEKISRHLPMASDQEQLEISLELPDVHTVSQQRKLAAETTWLDSAKELIQIGLENEWINEEQIAQTLTPQNGTPPERFDQRLSSLLAVFRELEIPIFDCTDCHFWVGPESVVKDWCDRETANTAETETLVASAVDALISFEDTNSDPFDQYTKNLGARKILSRDEERSLAFEIQNAVSDSLTAIASSKIAMAELVRLIEAAAQGDIPLSSVRDDGQDRMTILTLRPEDLSDESDLEEEEDLEAGSHEEIRDPATVQGLKEAARYLRLLSNRMSEDCSLEEKKRLLEKTRQTIQELQPTQELTERLWTLIRNEDLDPGPRRLLETSVHRILTAKKEFFTANLRLVLWVQRRYKSLTPMDLIQEGNIGLLRAIDRFDPNFGAKFSTYATWWIRQAITRAISDKRRLIRFPVHVIESINKIEAVSRDIEKRLSREPTIEELSEATGFNIEKVLRLQSLPDDAVTESDLTDADLELIHQAPDNLFPTPEEYATQQELAALIDASLDGLDDRAAAVIRLRFGLGDDQNHTLEEVGTHFKVTRERIRQIEAKALNKLRASSRSKPLRDFLTCDVN